MEEKIKAFLEGVGKEILDYLGADGTVLITLGDSSYAVTIDEDRELEVEKSEKGNGDIEIITDEEIMHDLLSSSSMKEYREKMASYTYNDRKPSVKINMERTEKEAAKFIRTYLYFLRRMWLLN